MIYLVCKKIPTDHRTIVLLLLGEEKIIFGKIFVLKWINKAKMVFLKSRERNFFFFKKNIIDTYTRSF